MITLTDLKDKLNALKTSAEKLYASPSSTRSVDLLNFYKCQRDYNEAFLAFKTTILYTGAK